MTDVGRRYGPWAVIAGGSEGVGGRSRPSSPRPGSIWCCIARKPVALEETAALCRAHGVEVRPLALDLTAPDSVARVIDEVEDVEVGLLIYNAGANTHSEQFLDGDLAEFQKVIDLNITTPWRWSTTSAGPCGTAAAAGSCWSARRRARSARSGTPCTAA